MLSFFLPNIQTLASSLNLKFLGHPPKAVASHTSPFEFITIVRGQYVGQIVMYLVNYNVDNSVYTI